MRNMVMDAEELQTFDFLINDEDEVMLLLYEQEGEPKDSRIELNPEEKSAILYRNPDTSIMLDDIPDDVFDSLAEADKLMVCELSAAENEDDTEIVYAYEADIDD